MESQVFRLNNMERKALEANRDPKVIEDRHYRRDLAVELFQDPAAVWMVRINDGAPLLATDVEVHLWKMALSARQPRPEVA